MEPCRVFTLKTTEGRAEEGRSPEHRAVPCLSRCAQRLNLRVARSAPGNPLEAGAPLRSAGLRRPVHLAALSYSVCAEEAVQEDRGQLCHLVPVDGGLGHAVDRALQVQSKNRC